MKARGPSKKRTRLQANADDIAYNDDDAQGELSACKQRRRVGAAAGAKDLLVQELEDDLFACLPEEILRRVFNCVGALCALSTARLHHVCRRFRLNVAGTEWDRVDVTAGGLEQAGLPQHTLASVARRVACCGKLIGRARAVSFDAGGGFGMHPLGTLLERPRGAPDLKRLAIAEPPGAPVRRPAGAFPSPPSLLAIGALPALESLSITVGHESLAGVRALGNLPRLKDLVLRVMLDARYNGAGLIRALAAAIGRAPALRALDVTLLSAVPDIGTPIAMLADAADEVLAAAALVRAARPVLRSWRSAGELVPLAEALAAGGPALESVQLDYVPESGQGSGLASAVAAAVAPARALAPLAPPGRAGAGAPSLRMIGCSRSEAGSQWEGALASFVRGTPALHFVVVRGRNGRPAPPGPEEPEGVAVAAAPSP
eukprot:tig00020563_g11243.t1